MSVIGHLEAPQITNEARPQQAEPEKRLRDFFRLSFRFSQGNLRAQENMFRWVVATNQLDAGVLSRIGEHIPDYITDLTPPTKHVDSSSIKTPVIEAVWERLHRARQGVLADNHTSPHQLEDLAERHLTDITWLTIAKDMLYQDPSHPRPGRPIFSRRGDPPETQTPEADSMNDPHASILRKYAILGEPTGDTAFDAMFRAIKVEIQLADPEEGGPHSLHRKLTVLGREWEQNHHGEKFFPEGFQVTATR